MYLKEYEGILYDAYKKIGQRNMFRPKKVEKRQDIKQLQSMETKIAKLLGRLTCKNATLSEDLEKYIVDAKVIFPQYYSIKWRNPDCIAYSFGENMDKLIRVVCHHEAEMIRAVLMQTGHPERIDLRSVFRQEKYLKHLNTELAYEIVNRAIRDLNNKIVFMPKLYVTKYGSRFHRFDCPYCKGKNLMPMNAIVDEQKELLPCKCLREFLSPDEADKKCITAFVDESLHPVLCDNRGKKGKAGSYSYIICWGDLNSEKEITADSVITEGVDFASEYNHIERIAETAIGKVLLTIAYDLEFHGEIKIFTDNKSAAERWKGGAKNSKLAKDFSSVKVVFITREKNKKADALGRTRMLLDMPRGAYAKMVKKMKRAQNAEAQVRLLELKLHETREKLAALEMKNQKKERHFSLIFRYIKKIALLLCQLLNW